MRVVMDMSDGLAIVSGSNDWSQNYDAIYCARLLA